LFGLLDEHDWDVVHNWIDAAASGASQAFLLFSQLDRFFAGRADENIQQFLGDGHNRILKEGRFSSFVVLVIFQPGELGELPGQSFL